MRARLEANLDLLAVVALALVSAVVIALAPSSAPTVVAGVVLELILPGYALSAMVFARREIRGFEFALCCIGTSLAVAALGGLALDGLPGELDQAPWIALLLAVTLIAATVGIVRSPVAELPLNRFRGLRPDRGVRDQPERQVGLPPAMNLIVGVVAAALAIGALVIARDATSDGPGFTELSTVPVSSGAAQRLKIAVASHEKANASFVLAIRESGRTVKRESLRLRPGEERQRSLPLDSETGRVLVTLYRAGDPAPYLKTSYDPSAGPVARSVR